MTFDGPRIRTHAETFSTAHFDERFRAVVDDVLARQSGSEAGAGSIRAQAS